MPLFHSRVINKHIKNFENIPQHHIETLGRWADNLNHGIYDSETQHDDVFIQRILVDVLGYVRSSDGKEWTLAKNIPVGRGNVDAALGHFTADTASIIAPLELKGAKTRDLDAVMAGRNKTPVQQAWEYAMDAKGAQWVLVSNYREIRLYAVGYGRKDYESFDLGNLTNKDQYARFILLLSAQNLLSGKTLTLLKESEQAEEDITDKLYKDYKDLRARLIKTLSEDNPEKDKLDIIRYTQTILDRILFVAFAEDKGLLPEKTLEKAYKSENLFNPQPVWENFKGLFHAINKGNPKLNITGYNGGLFADDANLNSLNISDELCEGFKRIGEYNFDSDISVNILGHIFEQSISDLEELKAQAEGQEIALDKKEGKRKKDGIFYTPPYITRYIVEQAVGGWLNDRKKEIGINDLPILEEDDFNSIKVIERGQRKGQILYNKKIESHIQAWESYRNVLSNIKVLDPACGSGAFLNEVFDYLKNEGEAVNNQLASLRGGQTTVFRWDTHILANNIYGVDLNSESVEITKLSLWLKTANKNEKLTYLENNIKVGNSLIDNEAIAGKLAFDWNKEFSEIMGAGGFDVIVGNPPYIPIEFISEQEKLTFKQKYDCLERKYDTSVVFILHGLNLLNKNGLLSFISSVTWQTGKNYKQLRKLLLENYKIKEILNLPFDVFADAYVDTCIYTIGGKNNPENGYDIFSYNKKDHVSNIEGIDFEHVPYKLSLADEDNSIILNPRVYSLKSRIESSLKTEKLGNISNSTQGLAKNKFSFKDAPFGNAHPFLFEAEIKRYKLEPKIIKYTELNDKKSLEPFYHSEPKILIRRLISRQDRLLCTYTDKNYVFSKDTNPFILHHQNDTFYTLALLNSRLLSYLYVNLSSIATKDDFRQTTLAEIRNLPIAIPLKNQKEKISSHAKDILDAERELDVSKKFFRNLLTSEFNLKNTSHRLENWFKLSFSEFIDEIEKALKPSKLTLQKKSEWIQHFETEKTKAITLKNEIDRLDAEIDQMVYALYDLSPEEISIIESQT